MAYIGNLPTTTAFITDQFSGNGSTTAFTMSAAPANTNSIIVAVSGVLQDPTTYSVSGTTLTFSAAPPSGTGNISVRFLGIPASGVTTTAYRTVTEFTATAGQTSFSVPSYTVGYIDVYRNGAKLGTADFTATTGTTVVLTSGASSGDLVQTVSFYVSSVLNAIPATAGAVTSSYIANDVTINFADGSASTPSITNNGDTDTGIYFSAANTVDVATNGTAALQLDSSQNLKFNSGYGSVATAYGIRAWVNYKGTATRAINASGNVSSITYNGTGDYTVNFTTALVDANYGVAMGPVEGAGTAINAIITYASGGAGTTPTLKSTTQFRFVTSNNGTLLDFNSISLAFIR